MWHLGLRFLEDNLDAFNKVIEASTALSYWTDVAVLLGHQEVPPAARCFLFLQFIIHPNIKMIGEWRCYHMPARFEMHWYAYIRLVKMNFFLTVDVSVNLSCTSSNLKNLKLIRR